VSTYDKLVNLAVTPFSVGLEHQILVCHIHTVLKRLTTIRVLVKTKPAPWDSYGRYSSESTVDHQDNYSTNITTMVEQFALAMAWDLWIHPI
jgi:hypothetical protein